MVTVDKQAAVPTSMELTCNLITFFVFFPLMWQLHNLFKWIVVLLFYADEQPHLNDNVSLSAAIGCGRSYA